MRKILTLWYDTWYGTKQVHESSETSFFGHGLFEQLGFDEVHIPLEFVRDDLSNALLSIASAGPYEAAFIVPQHETLFWLRDAAGKCPVIAWMTDDTWRHESFCKGWTGACDLIATTDSESHAKYTDAGFNSILTNWAGRPEWERYGAGMSKLQVARFHGMLYRDRRQKLDAIAAAGSVPMEYLWWGSADEKKYLQDMTQVLTEAQYHANIAGAQFSICLTDSSQGPKQMKGRMFEPQLHGSILVSEPSPRLEQYWQPDIECIVFDTPEMAQEKMASLLSDASRLARMAEKAKARLLSEHTYHHRLREVLTKIELSSSSSVSVPAPQDSISVIVAIGHCEPEPALASLHSILRNRPEGCEVILACYSEGGIEPWMTGYAARLRGRIIKADEPHLSSAMNGLIANATGDRLIMISPDIMVTERSMHGAAIANIDGRFWIPRIINLENMDDIVGPGGLTTSPYLLACKREDAIAAGGFDENYGQGIGYEGRDFCGRLGIILGAFFGDWTKVAYRMTTLPPSDDFAQLSEKNRHITMLKWKGMPFGGPTVAFNVTSAISRKGERLFKCQQYDDRIASVIAATKSQFVKSNEEDAA